MFFRLVQHQFHFRALESVFFPPEKAGNVWRGALGTILRFDRPPVNRYPGGLAEPPRPFVIRAGHLDGKRFGPGEVFSLYIHVFDEGRPWLRILTETFDELNRAGIGPRRGRMEFAAEPASANVVLDLTAGPEASHCSVLFRTPTELKGNPSRGEIPFGVLFARASDRLSTLRGLYGEGPLDLDFRAQVERASLVRTVSCDLHYSDVRRRSSRTGAEHGIGGVTGLAEYKGDLTEFLPWLRAAWWTGVGRHTVWGNGVIEVAAG